MNSRQGSRGLTLLELCFGLAVVGVLAGLSVPGFRHSLRTAAVRSASLELLAGLQQARTHAILQSRAGALCPLGGDGQCQAAGRPAAAWGWFLEAGDHRQVLGGQALPSGITVRATRSPLQFYPHSQAASPGTLTICDRAGVAAAKSLVVSLSGRARLQDARPGACAT
jgi:Tfp pilus assembly protein FimT